ncbi:hypothetical protein, partial [Staphylococcus pseudintermedius]|uniref:hypothetical protein n=1 Tax=Staphylococcus pseudintermedius TaxID=283734 RepID=UPI001BDE8A95
TLTIVLSYFAPHLNLLLQVLCHCMVWTTLASFNAISTVWAIKKATAIQSLKFEYKKSTEMNDLPLHPVL